MKLSSAASLALVFTASIVGCGSSDPEVSGAAGSSASAGNAGAPAAGSGGLSMNTAGAGQAGTSAGAAGASAGTGGVAGSAGGASGGSAGSTAGGGGMGGASAGAGGASFWGPGGPKKQWACPAPPYAAQTKGPAVNICNSGGFKYNYGYNEGPTWIASQNAFFFSNFIQGSNLGGDIIKYPLNGTCEVWLHDVGCNGLGVSPSGNLLGACHGPRAIMEYDMTTKVGRKVATMVGGKDLDSPNDLIARSDGNVYFSNTTFELGNRPPGLKEALVRIDPKGVTSVIEAGGLNGVALSPDETKLYVVGKGTFMLDAAGAATKSNGPTPGGDGIAVDCAGTISNTGTNSAFGGPDGKTLIAVGGGTEAKTYQMTVPGLP